MHHERTVLLAVFANVGHVEAFRQIEVKLNGGSLPFTTDGVFYFQVNLRSVERAAAFVNFTLESAFFDRLLR